MKFVILDDTNKLNTVIIMAPDGLATQRAWAPTAMVLTSFDPVTGEFSSQKTSYTYFNASFVICKQAIEHTIKLPLIWNTLMRAWRHCYDVISFLVPSTLSENAGVALRWPLGLWSWLVVSSPWLLENHTGCNSITLTQNSTKTSIMFLVCRPS